MPFFNKILPESFPYINEPTKTNLTKKTPDKYFESFFEYFDIIAKRPFSFESVDYIKKGYRRCVCGVDSIYYKVNEAIVEIVTIVGRQDLNEKL